jgi:hypothetical protein
MFNHVSSFLKFLYKEIKNPLNLSYAAHNTWRKYLAQRSLLSSAGSSFAQIKVAMSALFSSRPVAQATFRGKYV